MASRFRVLYQASQNNVSKLKLALSVHKQQKEIEVRGSLKLGHVILFGVKNRLE